MTYRERLTPSAWIYTVTVLLFPAGLLILAPIWLPAGIGFGILLVAGTIAVLVGTAPVVSVADGELRAGRARIPVRLTGTPEIFRGAEATAARGVDLDARAWLCLRGWIDPVVRIPVTDADDPTPYWLVSTRHPEELAAALAGNDERPADPR